MMTGNLGRYEIISELGRGAMGVVYKAKDPLIDRMVALKTINLNNIEPDGRKEYEARFHQEARAAGRLNHPNIVTIYDLGEHDGIAYIAMELMEGKELQHLIEHGNPLPVEQALEIAIQVVDGLAFAHERGIVHRDVKPSNIMVLKDNQSKIADFGIARLDSSLLKTKDGVLMGSPLYMSPEQIRNQTIDARSDIFSFGILMYQMLTGKLPFTGENVNAVMYQVVQENPKSPDLLNPKVPPELDTIVGKCLAKAPEARYQDARTLSRDLLVCLERIRNNAGKQAEPAKNQKRKLLAIAIVLFVLFEIIERFFFSR